MTISFRNRRRRTVAGAAVLAAALGGLAAAALPAHASAASAAAATSTSSSIPISGGSPPEGGGGTPIPVSAAGNAVITDSLTGSVTAPDAILTCATSQIAIGGTTAVTVPVGCLTLYNNQWVNVAWTGTGVTTNLAQLTNGNLAATAGTSKWSAGTTFSGNLEGPGCLAQFESNANLVVSNCDGELIWNSATHTYPDAVLAFQADGNIVIYENSSGTPLWATKT